MPYWMSIEVFDGAFSARAWAEAYSDTLVEEGLRKGAVDWSFHTHSWGVVFEIAFADETDWDRFRESLAVQIALDAVPDPVGGLIVYRGRGGNSPTGAPRRPRPLIGSGAAALPLPHELGIDDEFFHLFNGDIERRRLTAVGS